MMKTIKKSLFLRTCVNLSLLGFVFFLSAKEAEAAQSAQVIVPQANVYQYPQASSSVISRLNRGDSITVSNLPTAGFYKVRLPNGDMGWVSGNDVLSGGSGRVSNGGGGAGAGKPAAPARARKRRTDSDEAPSSASSNVDSFRGLIAYGVQSLSYSGISDTFGSNNTKGLNLGKNFSGELQFKINPKLFWSVKIESLTANSGVAQVTSSITQQVSVSEVPLEVGLVWSPISTHKFRWGFGVYVGVPVSSNATVEVIDSTTSEDRKVVYSSTEICGELATQFSIGLGDAFGIFAEAAYRYDKTGATPSSTDTNTGVTFPSFKIDYSGIRANIGLEIRL